MDSDKFITITRNIVEFDNIDDVYKYMIDTLKLLVDLDEDGPQLIECNNNIFSSKTEIYYLIISIINKLSSKSSKP